MKNTNINSLINEYRNNNNQEAFNQVFKTYERMIFDITKKIYNIEDAYSVACLGFVKAINSFDTERGIQFSTYAYRLIWNEFKTLFAKDERTIKATSYDETIGDDEKTNILDTIASDINIEAEAVEKEEYKILYDLIDKYAKKNDKKKTIIKLTLTEKYTQEDIAKIIGTSRGYVSKIFIEFEKYIKTVKIA